MPTPRSRKRATPLEVSLGVLFAIALPLGSGRHPSFSETKSGGSGGIWWQIEQTPKFSWETGSYSINFSIFEFNPQIPPDRHL
jgi:hypothetical protein